MGPVKHVRELRTAMVQVRLPRAASIQHLQEQKRAAASLATKQHRVEHLASDSSTMNEFRRGSLGHASDPHQLRLVFGCSLQPLQIACSFALPGLCGPTLLSDRRPSARNGHKLYVFFALRNPLVQGNVNVQPTFLPFILNKHEATWMPQEVGKRFVTAFITPKYLMYKQVIIH